VKLVVVGAVVIFLVFYIMTSPDHAANIVHSSWHTAVHVAHGLGNFVDKLAS
jgi:NADH:ubiquinone oxidoreductase subunit 6 (subunit J)